MLRICYSVNGAKVTLLILGIYKHMKGAATHLFKGQSENRGFFSQLSNVHFDLRPNPRANLSEDRGAKTRIQGQLECANLWGSPGGWSGLELTDTLIPENTELNHETTMYCFSDSVKCLGHPVLVVYKVCSFSIGTLTKET